MELLIRYPLDLTGQNPDNYVKGETHVLKDLRFRAIAPYYGAFFSDSLQIYDEANGKQLERNKDYVTAEILQDKTELTGQPVNGVIIVINRKISKNVKISYQALGGDNFKNNQSIENLLKVEHDDDNVSYSYIDMNGRPEEFKPIFHLHSVAEIYGFEYMVYLMETLRNAIIWKKIDLCKSIIKLIDTELDIITNLIVNRSDEVFDRFLNDFKYNFKKEMYGLELIENYAPVSFTEINSIVKGERVNLSEENYITLESLSLFKEELYSFIVSKSKTGLGVDYGIVSIPTKENLANALNGTRFLIDSFDVAKLTNQQYDITVFPDLTAIRTKFSIYKLSNLPEGRGGLFMATNLYSAKTYIGKLTKLGNELLMEWNELQTAQVSDVLLNELVDHLGDRTNPHKDQKEHVGFHKLENLSVASKEDVLAQLDVRKYITAENLPLFMKGFMAGQPDNNEISEEGNINLMKRFDVVFSGCGDALADSIKSSCVIEEVDLSFNVFTQRLKYRSAARISQNPNLASFDPVIYEGYTKLVGNSLQTDYTNRAGIKLINLPEVLKINQYWQYGTLYQGFRSGVDDHALTAPYYDTLLVVRGSLVKPTVNNVLEVVFIKSYDEILTELGGMSAVADMYEFPMRKGDYLLHLKLFNKPPSNATEQEILNFEKIEQTAKVDIYSAGYTFKLDVRTAVYQDYNFVTLLEKNSPKIIPAFQYPDLTKDWYGNINYETQTELYSSVVVGQVSSGNKKLDILPNAEVGINTLVSNFRDNPTRPGYVTGTKGMSIIKLNNDGTEVIDAPTSIHDLPRDTMYDGILGINLENDKATVLFNEQLDLAKTINYNLYFDPFIDINNVIRPIPYQDLSFHNPYATGNNSAGETRYDAFLGFMKLGFTRLNALDSVTEKYNSSKGQITLKVLNPNDPNEEFTVTLGETPTLNSETFRTLFDNYVNNINRVKHYIQPDNTQPFVEALDIPKRFVNRYKQSFRIVEEIGERKLVYTTAENPTNIDIDVIEISRLEGDQLMGEQKTVEYNSLFNRVAIVKKWGFKGIREVIDIQKYINGVQYPNQPSVVFDNQNNTDERVIDVYCVGVVEFNKYSAENPDNAYREDLYDIRNFKVMAFNDLPNKEIVIHLESGNPGDDVYRDIALEIQDSMGDDDLYQIEDDKFSTFDIMYGNYDQTNKITYDKESRTVTIDMSESTDQTKFFNHHLTYLKWKFKIELVPTVITTVPYPVMAEDSVTSKFSFMNAFSRNYGHKTYPEDSMGGKYTFTTASYRRTIAYRNATIDTDHIRTAYSFTTASVRRVIGYRNMDAGIDRARAGYSFVNASVRVVVKYVLYPNYVADLMNSKIEFVNVGIRTVRLP